MSEGKLVFRLVFGLGRFGCFGIWTARGMAVVGALLVLWFLFLGIVSYTQERIQLGFILEIVLGHDSPGPRAGHKFFGDMRFVVFIIRVGFGVA
jgi:hypothetical protein